MKRIFILLDTVKLELLIICSFAYTWIAMMQYYNPKSLFRYSIDFIKRSIVARRYIRLHKREFIYTKHIIYHSRCAALTHIFGGLIVVAWLCEKMKVNLKIEGRSDFFDNDMIVNNPLKFRESCFITDEKSLFGSHLPLYEVAIMYMRSEYGYKILSQLSIKQELRECADEWFDSHIKGDWTAVHYRGADLRASVECSRWLARHNYISYLQGILDPQCSIFVCSDQEQFIDEMHVAFPDRIYARNIRRSYDNKGLHVDPEYKGISQQKDAMIDALILAKANVVYTTGSGFVDATRYLNPSIKIVSLDERWSPIHFSMGRNSPNGAPIPRKDLLKQIVKHHE